MSSIAVLKELAQAQTPLLLFDVTFPDGSVYHWSTHTLSYMDQSYQARVLRHNFFEIQTMSEQGIDQIPRITLVLANADSQMSQLNAAKGFKGATVLARFLFYDLAVGVPASESLVPFTGYCNPPDQINDLELKVTAINRMNMQRVNLPPVKIQRRCPWAFPSTPAQRTEAASDPNSKYYACGYSPDIVVDNVGGAGKFESGSTPFTSCTFTRQACITRGMFSQDERTTLAASASAGATTILLNNDIARVGETVDIDGQADPTAGFANQEERQVIAKSGGGPYAYTISSALQKAHSAGVKVGRPTRSFGGIEFTPETVDVRPFGSPFFLKSPVQGNPAKYNDFISMIYGTAWVEPAITVLRNDGNLTRMECVLSLGHIAGVHKLVVNEYEIPLGIAGRDMTASGWYNLVNDGGRFGGFDLNFTDRGGNPQGDPYGSMAYLFVAIPSKVNDGKSIPQVKVLVDGRQVETFAGDGSSLGRSFTNNPVWVLLDILKQARWKLNEMDLPSFVAAASFAGQSIPATDNNGNAVSVPRFQCNLVLRQRRPAADVLLGIRNNARLFFTYGNDGKLRLNVENTLAAQQPTLPFGSNASSPLEGGWPAYAYSGAAILRHADGASSLRVYYRPISDTPNRLAFEFQDAFNGYVQDSFAIDDLEDQSLIGQDISQTLVVDGIPTYDQASRIAKFHLDKSVSGNTYVEFETSVKALGQQVGQIVTITYPKEGWVDHPFRILRLAPQQNFRLVRITAQGHNDDWYADTNGQLVPPRKRPRQPRLHPRPPNPLVGTKARADGDFDWDISESRSSDADGGGAVELTVPFAVPVNRFSVKTGPPAADLTATVSSTGGTLPGGETLYYALTASDADGEESTASFTIAAQVPEGTSTNSATLTGLSLDPQTTTFSVYRGATPSKMFRIAAELPPASLFQDTGLGAYPAPLPDPFFDHANFYWKFRQTAPVTATIFGPSQIGSAALSLAPDQFKGSLARIWSGKGAGQVRAISSHTTDTLNVAPDWVVVPDSTSVFFIEEPDWKSASAADSTPARFRLPNQKNRVVLVEGRAADEQDLESPDGLAVVTDWVIGGVGPGVTDTAAPPLPTLGISVPRDGTLVFTPIGFETLENTTGISTGTYLVSYIDELAAASTTLSVPLNAADTTFTVASSAGFAAGDLVAMDSETILVEQVQDLTWTVSRGQKGTAAATHSNGATLFRQLTKLFTYPFELNFFGSPDSGRWRTAESLPNIRVAAVELRVTNAFGDSPIAVQEFLSFNSDAGASGWLPGLRTNRGGQFIFQVDGVLFIESAPTAPLPVHAITSVRDIYAVVGTAPSDAPVTVVLRRNAAPFATVTVSPGQTVSGTVSGASLAPLQPGDLLSFDLAGVGSTDPGQDLTLVVRI